jgi:predicted component of type VI protein secretion system
VAARHCALLVRGNGVFVRDLSGSLSTCVNGRPVQSEQELRDQDHVQVGRLAFTVRLECGSAPPRPEPVPPAEAEEAAATLLLALDAAEAPGATVVGLAAETLPVDGSPGDREPRVPDLSARPARPELGNTAAAAAQLLARFTKAHASGRSKGEKAARGAP